jgi:hypothetical protein
MTLQDHCRTYLEGLGCTLWGQAYNIKDENLEEAAEWLAEQVEAVQKLSCYWRKRAKIAEEDYATLLDRWKEEQRLRIKAEGTISHYMLTSGPDLCQAERKLADQLAAALRLEFPDPYPTTATGLALAAWEEARRG